MDMGAEAVLAEADLDKAKREADKDRAVLLAEKGDDANHIDVKLEDIRRRLDP